MEKAGYHLAPRHVSVAARALFPRNLTLLTFSLPLSSASSPPSSVCCHSFTLPHQVFCLQPSRQCLTHLLQSVFLLNRAPRSLQCFPHSLQCFPWQKPEIVPDLSSCTATSLTLVSLFNAGAMYPGRSRP